jgi:hypothetical protein
MAQNDTGFQDSFTQNEEVVHWKKKHVLSNLGKGSFPRGSKVLQGWKVIGKVGTFPSTPRLERAR